MVEESEQKLVLLERCFDLTQAHMIRGFLESNDIPCFLMDENHSAIAWHLTIAIGGARIMVFENDLEKAQSLLADVQEDASTKDTETKPILKKPYLLNIFLWLFGLLFLSMPFITPNKEDKK